MSVQTVTGKVNEKEMGIITPHEHVLIDLRNQFTEFTEVTKKVLSESKVSLDNLDVLFRNPYAIKDNLILGDIETAQEELLYFKKAGGKTIVDATSRGIGRDPEALRDLAAALDLNIVMGSGYYTFDTHPIDMDHKKVEEIAEEIINDINSSVEDTGIKAGVIGEIGTGETIHPNEKKVLIASAQAQKETGVAVIIHTYPWGKRGLEAIDILQKNGADIGKVSINHIDVEIDMDYCKEIISTGAYIEFDNFGKEYFIDKRYRGFAGGVFARDIERVKAIKKLIDDGLIKRILISCDVCLKTLLHRYGGWGYDHILNNIVPMLREEGIAQGDLEELLKNNPREFINVPE
ncbi:MAG: phosphotriesterase family protein [Actinomycetota bacterium]